MGLSKLTEKCRGCPKQDTCDHKEMEAVAVITPVDYGRNVLDCGTTVKLPDLDPQKYLKEILDQAAREMVNNIIIIAGDGRR